MRHAVGRFCSTSCRTKGQVGEKGASWKGGRQVNNNGYVMISSYGHPAGYGHGNYVLEHRLVMEKNLGRFLTQDETVHHINGDKSDNRIENLQLRQGKHGTGVIHQCLDCGSTNIKSVEISDSECEL